MNPVQNNAILHAAWKCIPDLAFPARAFDQITNFKIESVFIIFFSWYIVHKFGKIKITEINIKGVCYHKISRITRNINILQVDRRGFMDAEKAFSRRSFGVILLFMGVLCLLLMALGYWGIIHISERLTALASTHPDIADFKAVANWVADARGGFIRYGSPLVAAGFALWSLLLWLAIGRNPSKPQDSFAPISGP